jgi:hypothetical protein
MGDWLFGLTVVIDPVMVRPGGGSGSLSSLPVWRLGQEAIFIL